MKTILLIDESEQILGSLSLALRAQERNCAVLTATDGRDAVEIMKVFRIDLIFTDLSMPAADGYHLIEYRNRHCPKVPLLRVASTGAATDTTQTQDVIETLVHRIREKVMPCTCPI